MQAPRNLKKLSDESVRTTELQKQLYSHLSYLHIYVKYFNCDLLSPEFYLSDLTNGNPYLLSPHLHDFQKAISKSIA